MRREPREWYCVVYDGDTGEVRYAGYNAVNAWRAVDSLREEGKKPSWRMYG